MYYVGNYEKEVIAGGSTKEYDYICTPEGLTVIAVKTNGVRSLYYVQTDHLGSIRVATTAAKGIQTRYYYDAWGKQTLAAGTSITNRGYIGHEHLAEFGLINMNARLYDPALGRFLSLDPFVQMPDYTQSYNRYAYCINNPLRYTDPTGEYFGIDDLIAAIIGGTVNLVINIVQGNVHSIGQGFALFGVGAAGGVLTIYVGPWAGGAVIGAGNSFVNQGFGSSGNWNWGNISGQQVLFDGIMGGLTGQLGSALGGAISPAVSNLTSGIGGQAVQQALTQGITGSAVGFTMNTGFALMNGASLEDALKAGGQGALTGLAIGTVSGVANGMRAAYKSGENPWNGNPRATQTAPSNSNARIVTSDGVVLPEGATIPDNLIENPNRSGSYGVIDANGKFQEVVRIDQGTPQGKNGPTKSHFHLNGDKEHIYDTNRWPWWR